MRPTRFRIELFVADVPTSIRFYRDVLGFELGRRESDYASRADGAWRRGTPAAMAFSSVSVVVNALRLRRFG